MRIASGTVAAQAIVMGATPLLTRLYAPEEFGALAVFTALHAVLAGVFTLKYDLSIMLPQERGDAIGLTRLTMAVSLLFSSLLLLALVIARVAFAQPLHAYYFLLPLSAVLAAAYTCVQQWAGRANDFHQFSRSQVVSAIANVAVSLLLGVVSSHVVGSLTVGYVCGLVAALLFVGARGWHRAPNGRYNSHRLKALALEYRRFPLYVLPSSFIQTLSASAPPFLLQTFFSLKDVGHYAIASRFLLVPGILIGSAVAEAFRSEFVERQRQGGSVTRLFRSTLQKLSIFALPVFLALFAAGPLLFEVVFGAAYREAGVLARYLCLGVAGQFFAQPFGYVFVATGHVRLGLLVHSLATFLPLAGIVFGGVRGHSTEAFLLWSVLTVATSLLLVWLAHRSCVEWESGSTRRQEHLHG